MAAQAPAQPTTPAAVNGRRVLVLALRLLVVVAVVALVPVLLGLEWRGFERIFSRVSNLRFIALGLSATVAVSLVAILVSLPVATGLALARLSSIKVIRLPAVAIVESIRALPLLLFIFYINLRFPGLKFFEDRGVGGTDSFFDIVLQRVLSQAGLSVTLALILYTAAVNAELLRSGILSLDRGQTEAARSLGLTYWQTMRRVILPQAFRRTLAPLVAQFTILVKDTSLGSIIGFLELQRVATQFAQRDYNQMEALYVVALIYFAVNYILGAISRLIERSGPSVEVRTLEF